MKYILIILLVLMTNLLWATQKNYEVTTTISNDRKEVIMLIKNLGQKDIFCSSVKVQIKYCNSNFCEVVGNTTKYLNNIYVKNTNAVEVKIEDTFSSIRRTYPEAIVQDVFRLNDSNCNVASFKNYCEWADKNIDEQYTVNEILKYENSEDCDFNEDKAVSYKLKYRNIKNLNPFLYLPVERIDLEGNSIEDASALSKIDTLWKVDISNNPINSLNSLLRSDSIIHLRAVNMPNLDLSKVSLVPKSFKFFDMDIKTP